MDSFTDRCAPIDNQEDCEREGANAFSDGVCDWITGTDVDTTEAPSVMDTTEAPSEGIFTYPNIFNVGHEGGERTEGII